MKLSEADMLVLESQGIRLIDSETFSGLKYGISDKGIKIFAGRYGKLCVTKENIREYLEELKEVAELHLGV